MKILYIHQHFSTSQGAAGQRSYEMAKRLVARGHDVTVVCGRYHGGHTGLTHAFEGGIREGVVEGIHIIEYDLAYSNHDSFIKRTFIFFRFVINTLKKAAFLDYDLIFASSTPLTTAIPGIFARWFRAKPFVLEIRDLWPELPKAMGVIKNPIILFLIGLLERLSYFSAQHIIALSPGMVQGILKRGVLSDDVTFISNGCDFEIFDTISDIKKDDIPSSIFTAIYAGTHGLANGLDAVLDAALELRKRNRHDIRIVLYGDGKLKAKLEQKAVELGLENVVFRPSLPKKEIACQMKQADIGLQILANIPAFYDGTSPNKFFDYIAAGLPVLINYPGWLADKIEENDCGFVVPPDDPIAFADVLERAVSQKNLSEKGMRAKILAKKEFDRMILSEKWVSVLEETFAKHSDGFKIKIKKRV